ncbi:GlsB/YeaQ/YmgE family stress response membrane protein [Bosea sp. TWI1241]|uniref:GlsB/YeaQ/YmgE family stress response membrane protein n=1 Tax=Bosea sp. TWI1241 TaxID=3148904 RepID=UPI00320B9A07
MTRARKPRSPRKPDRIVPDEQVEILPPARSFAPDWPRLLPPVAFGTAAGFLASFVVGGGGLLRHAVVGLLGMLVGQGIVGVTGWRASTGYRFLDSMAMAVIGAVVVVLLARFIA